METLASFWARDPCDPSDPGQKHQPPPSYAWESQCVFSTPPAGVMWSEQLSPHLQRNKQLQDTLLQREEELARLQEENNKLKDFLNSSFVRNLEQKAKKLTADGRKKLKRNLMNINDGPYQNLSHQLPMSPQVSKRVCRNLTAEFCSAETSCSSEPNLDLWVLRTLGLKDRDTIDTSCDSSSPRYSLSRSVHDVAVAASSDTPTPSSVHDYCQRSMRETDCRSSAECQEANLGDPAIPPQISTTSVAQCSNFTATGVHTQASEAVTRSYETLTAYQSPPLTQEQSFTPSPDRAEICTITALNQVQTLEGNQPQHPTYWSPLRGSQVPSQDKSQFSPTGEGVPFPRISSSSPVVNQLWSSPTSPSVGSWPPATPETPRSRTDLAFSMSLSPSSSVKTHSFPQGQAFIRKDPEGRWNFTWVPRQES